VPWIVEYVLNHVARRPAGATSERLAEATGPKIAVAAPCTKRSAINAPSEATPR
jgi:hypothetical protein